MSKRKSRPFTTAAAILVTGFLIAFFAYLWTFDYKVPKTQEFSLKRELRGMLRVSPQGDYGYTGPVAVLTLANASQERVRLLDTRQLQPLYELHLIFKPEDGSPQVVMEQKPQGTLRRTDPKDDSVFDKDNDAVAELVVGAAYTRAIPLMSHYTFKDKGTYDLTVSYKPDTIAQKMGQGFEYLNVTRESFSVTTSFKWPPEPQAEEKPVEKHETKAEAKSK